MINPPRFLPLLTAIIDAVDPYGVGHSERVARLAMQLARKAGIKDNTTDMDDLELAALLHDVGKVRVPESIRRIPGKYTFAERAIMKQHSVFGVELLEKVNGGINLNVKLFVKHHHEDWDGTGYPDRLREEAIPWGARNLRIVDSFDSMTHERGYQPPRSKADALQLMIDEQIRQPWADPNLFRIFLEMMKD
jgi:putative nucleotidyltransferase with HDIG domain